MFSMREQSVFPPNIQEVMREIRGGNGDNGIVTASGDDCKEQRRFTLKQLKDFGLGKKSIESIIKEETDAVLKDFSLNKDVLIKLPFSISILNIVWRIVAKKRFEVSNFFDHR